MGKIRRGGFVFLWWKGDHGPKHVHVYRNGRLQVTWDLEAGQAMRGRMTRKILQILRELQSEGWL